MNYSHHWYPDSLLYGNSYGSYQYQMPISEFSILKLSCWVSLLFHWYSFLIGVCVYCVCLCVFNWVVHMIVQKLPIGRFSRKKHYFSESVMISSLIMTHLNSNIFLAFETIPNVCCSWFPHLNRQKIMYALLVKIKLHKEKIVTNIINFLIKVKKIFLWNFILCTYMAMNPLPLNLERK